jgi:ABC-type lipoprotein release transport system permease subunit
MALPLLYNLRSVRVRWRVTLLAVLGIALVVAVCAVLMATAEGFATALRSTGRSDNAIVVQRGSPSELMSHVPLEERNVILLDERLARGVDGQVLASWERVLVLSLRRRSDGRRTNVLLRAVPPAAFQVRGEIRLVAGRRFTPGLPELIVGRRIQDRVRGAGLGSTLRYGGVDFGIVGVFESAGAAFESEVWGDSDTLSGLFHSAPGSNSLVARMKDPSQIPALDHWLKTQPQMQLRAVSERQYYEDQSGPVVIPLETLAALVALIMGVGAVFGAMNTMYAIVAARTREIGTLRALGFSRGTILLSFVLESALLALVGGAAGCLLASVVQGQATGASNLQSLSGVAFAFRVTPGIVSAGLLFALAMGVVGGLLPALRAARLPIAAAIRAV